MFVVYNNIRRDVAMSYDKDEYEKLIDASSLFPWIKRKSE